MITYHYYLSNIKQTHVKAISIGDQIEPSNWRMVVLAFIQSSYLPPNQILHNFHNGFSKTTREVECCFSVQHSKVNSIILENDSSRLYPVKLSAAKSDSSRFSQWIQ